MSDWIFLGALAVWALWPLVDGDWWNDPESF
jgi:hypothetical protein